MTEQFLDRADVVAGIQQVSGERVAQGVTANALVQPRNADGALNGPLQRVFVNVMAPHPA